MLQAKFQDHRTSGSGEEDFQRFLPYMGEGPSWSCDQHDVIRFSLTCT